MKYCKGGKMTRKLMLVALVALVVCTGFGFKASCTAPATEWRLTIRSTEGGCVPIPGEGIFWYDDGQAVVLSARPDPGYQFVNWTGKVHAVNDVYKATTTIHMTLDYTITANFAPLP
jgi:uncharacterized repeat protein (TIGR02543 family)